MRVCNDVETSSAASEMTAQMRKMFSSSNTAIGKSGAHRGQAVVNCAGTKEHNREALLSPRRGTELVGQRVGRIRGGEIVTQLHRPVGPPLRGPTNRLQGVALRCRKHVLCQHFMQKNDRVGEVVHALEGVACAHVIGPGKRWHVVGPRPTAYCVHHKRLRVAEELLVEQVRRASRITELGGPHQLSRDSLLTSSAAFREGPSVSPPTWMTSVVSALSKSEEMPATRWPPYCVMSADSRSAKTIGSSGRERLSRAAWTSAIIKSPKLCLPIAPKSTTRRLSRATAGEACGECCGSGDEDRATVKRS
eukprot:scaffold58950_cov63-Phaeocystis_antarctica.AAC.9